MQSLTEKSGDGERRRATITTLEKMNAAEEGLQSIARAVQATISSDISLKHAIAQLQQSRERLASYETLKKEADRAAERMLGLDDDVPQESMNGLRGFPAFYAPSDVIQVQTAVKGQRYKGRGRGDRIQDYSTQVIMNMARRDDLQYKMQRNVLHRVC
ncbi:unnamed protein product [Heligmosomoides polygyrus]|uniref:V-SNARE domain-containing protein n=1 Tax=Heligmosomoides polygyrus TaxID=6339 RepID=A0A183F202_HELPZ|nr:unnamed protein product [Heligmosomoides polygyrus]